jgi:hypothetical protein
MARIGTFSSTLAASRTASIDTRGRPSNSLTAMTKGRPSLSK